MGKPKIAIVLNVPGSRNPMLRFALDALSREYDITVITPDHFEGGSSFEGVTFENLAKSILLTQRLLRPAVFGIGIVASATKLFFNAIRLHSFVIEPLDIKASVSYLLMERVLIPSLMVRKVLSNGTFDAVICIDAGATVAARWLKRWKSIPYAYWIYEVYPNQAAAKLRCLEAVMRRVERRGCESADVIFEPASPFAKLVRRRYRLRRMNAETIWTCPEQVGETARLSAGTPMKFYYHGVYVPDRGLENLISAMALIEGGILYLRGFGVHEDRLRKLVRDKKISDKVIFLDPVPIEQLASEAANFDVGVIMVCMTSHNAKFVIGFKSFENIAAGLPLLAPASFPLRELVNLYNIGILYEDCSVEDLAASLSYCIEHPDKVREWKMNSREFGIGAARREQQSQKLQDAIGSLVAAQY